MNKEEAIEQLYRLSLDWEENGLDTKLNQTDINAIKIIVDELDIANNKIKEVNAKLKDLLEGNTYELPRKCCYARLKEIDSIIGGE